MSLDHNNTIELYEKPDLFAYQEYKSADESGFEIQKDFVKKNNSNPNPLRFINRQNIIMNNYKKSHIVNKDFILNNIYSTDTDICDKIYNLIENPYQKKINLIHLILDSDLIIPIKNIYDVVKFFNWLTPLNIEHKMSSREWSQKTIRYGNKVKILLQNSISKSDLDKHFTTNYINKIKKVFNNSNIQYTYFEFKSKRFTKIKDIIWVFDKL